MDEPIRDPEPLPAAPVEGYVDNCDRTHVSGWCWRSDRPDGAVELSVSIGGRELGRTKADKFRRDLLL